MNKHLFALTVLALLAALVAACAPAAPIQATATSDYVAPMLATTARGSDFGGMFATGLFALVLGGIAAGVTGYFAGKSPLKQTFIIATTFLVIAGILFGGGAAKASYTVIDAGEVGVVVEQGKYVETLDPGAHWITPWAQKVVVFTTREFTFSTLSDPTQGSEQYRTYTLDITTSDNVMGTVKYQVQANVDPTKAHTLYTKYGSLENAIVQLIKTPSLSIVRDVLRGKTAVEIVTGIDAFNAEVESQLREIAAPGGIHIVRFSFRKPDLGGWEAMRNSAAEAIEAAVKAQNDALTVKNQQEAEIFKANAAAQINQVQAEAAAKAAITKAEADAQVKQIQADANAYTTTTQAAADAEANQIVTKSLSDQLIEYLRWKLWDGKLPSVVVNGEGTDLLVTPGDSK